MSRGGAQPPGPVIVQRAPTRSMRAIAAAGFRVSALGRGRRIELRRFGVFNVKPRKTGIGSNPRTGQELTFLRVKR